jgi:ketosteroid isomerase-like protein
MNRWAAAVGGAGLACAALASLLYRRHNGHENGDGASVVRRYFDAWQEGDADTLGTIVSPDYRGHVHALAGTDDRGRDELAEHVRAHQDAFAWHRFEIEDMLGAHDRVAARVRMRAAGPEGSEAEMEGLVIFRLEDGKIAEEWASWDYLGLARTLGLAPDLG